MPVEVPVSTSVTGQSEESEGKEAPSKPVIGIIYPPPEVRNIVDKTAGFVARNGQTFEVRIRQNEINNPKFNFLNPNDPYHAYYQHKVNDFREGKGQEPAAPRQPSAAVAPATPAAKPAEVSKSVVELIAPKQPPPENEFISDPPSISAFDLDIVKLTAQFVARNGRQFLTNLMNRESRNYQFDFLRPQHSLFNYFTKLVEQYTKVMIPPKDLMNKLRIEADTQKGILDEVKKRVEWIKFQEREKQKIEEAVEKERVAYAQIGWHDFVVVETVDFQPNETGNLPPPTTPDLVGARVLAQERAVDEPEEEPVRKETSGAGEMDIGSDSESEPELPQKNMEEDEVDDDASTASEAEDDSTPAPPPPSGKPGAPPLPSGEVPQPPPQPPAPDQVLVKKDYDPKAKRLDAEEEKFLISPLTQEKIPADKLSQHMRYSMLDPSWVAQKERSTRDKQEQDSIAPGSSISAHLSNFAERRTDIFGAEETQIGKKIGEEKAREDTVQWDGHSGSADQVRAKAREGITSEQIYQDKQERLGLVSDPSKERIGPKKGEGEREPVKPTPTQSEAPPPRPPNPIERPPRPPMGGPPMPMGGGPMGGPPAPMGGPRQPPPQPRPPPQGMQQPNMMVIPPRPHMMAPPQPPGPPGPPGGAHMVGIPVMQPRPPMGFMPPQPVPVQMMEEPPAKRVRTEEQLIPEDQFIRAQPQGPMQFQVAVPNVPEKPEWKLNGQSLTLTLPLTDPISVIKAKLHEALGIPAGKQKLMYEGMFIKDSNSLAFYNVNKGSTIQLQLKERGGRKK